MRGFPGGSLSPAARLTLGLAAAAFAGPFVLLLVASLAFRWTWPDLLPDRWWWEARGTPGLPVAWDYVLGPSGALPALANTVLIALAVALLSTLLCLPAAYAVATDDFRGRGALELFLLGPLIVPEIAVGLGMLVISLQLGLTGSYAGVVLAHLVPTVPYTFRVLTAGFQNLGPDLAAQARTLGASPLQVAWRVTLPLVTPSLLTGGLFAFLVSSNLFLLTFFVGRGEIETLPTLLFAKLAGGGVLDPVAAGLAVLASLPGVALLAAAERLLGGEGVGNAAGR